MKNMPISRLPSFLQIPRNKKIVVLAPHPDDETIGAGGYLQYAKKYNKITVIFITDGSKGYNEKYGKEVICSQRMDEAKQVCADLGAESIFLEFKDKRFQIDEKHIEKLDSILHQQQPDIVMLPHIKEYHRDHVYVNYLLCNCSIMCARNISRVFLYEVWTPLLPNRIINITDVFQNKIDMAGIYKSQTESLPYIEMIHCMNRYRSMILPLPKYQYMEAYLEYGADEYLNYVRKFNKE